MILIVGASGRLGSLVSRQLLQRGEHVRVMGRSRERLADLERQGASVFIGDVRDVAAVRQAVDGADMVLSSIQALTGKGGNNPRTVDEEGNRHLIDAARAAHVQRFVLVSARGASPTSQLEFLRRKYAAEQYLRQSGLQSVILRPTAYMEYWAGLVGEPILKTGRTTIYGSGRNPINFVSVDDVAHLTGTVLSDPAAVGRVIEIGGPQNFTLNEVADHFQRLAGKPAEVRHMPLAMLRVMSVAMMSLNPTLARVISAAIWMDTDQMAFDPSETLRQFPMRLTSLDEVTQARYAEYAQAATN